MYYTCRRTEQKAAEYESIKEAIAGTLEFSDLLVKVAPSDNGAREVVINSEIIKRVTKQITRVVTRRSTKLDVGEGSIVIENKGAFDCMIRAWVQTAVLRGCGTEELEWEKLYETAW